MSKAGSLGEPVASYCRLCCSSLVRLSGTVPFKRPLVALCASEIGLGLTAFGIVFTILGMVLLFDRGLIAMGNVSLSGQGRSFCLLAVHSWAPALT